MWNRSYILSSQLVLIPTLVIVVYFLWGFTLYTGFLSFTDSKFLPSHNWVGLKQYHLLWSNPRWIMAYKNLFIFGGLYLLLCILLGGFLAILLDQKVLFENLFRTVYLYPMSLSLVVTGLSWQWILNPTLGIQKVVNDKLPDKCRNIFILSRIEGKTNPEIAELLDLSVRTVENQIYRALKVLKKNLKNYM